MNYNTSHLFIDTIRFVEYKILFYLRFLYSQLNLIEGHSSILLPSTASTEVQNSTENERISIVTEAQNSTENERISIITGNTL